MPLRIALLAAVIIVGLGLAAWIVVPEFVVDTPACASDVAKPDCLTAAERLTGENGVRNSVLQATTAALFLVTAAFSLHGVMLTREGNEVARFSGAVELLDSDNETGSLGGVIALGRHLELVEDRKPTAALLASFLRRVAPAPPEGRIPNADDLRPLEVRNPRAHYALGLLGRRQVPTHSLDLTRIDARRADLARLSFRGADLSEAAFNGATLAGCDFRGCTLASADLRYADLRGARLENADLSHALLAGTDLSSAYVDSLTRVDGAQTDEDTMLPGRWRSALHDGP